MSRLLRLMALPSAALLLAAGCGSSGDSGAAAPNPTQPTTIKVSEVAGIPAAFLTYGSKQGFFAKHGLKLDIDTGAGGAAIIPGVVSGAYAIGGSNVVSVILAASKGVPIKMVASGTFAQDRSDQDFSAVLVGPKSDIREPADLAGKTIAVNTLKNIGDVTIKSALENHGVDPSSVKFTELGFPDMLPALEQGRVDAIWEIEPFLTRGLESGDKAIVWPYIEAKQGMQIGSYVAKTDYIASHKDVIDAFRAGLADTAASIEQDPGAFRKALPTLTDLSPDAAQKALLPVWKAKVDKASLDFVNRKMVDYDLIDKPADVDQILAPGAAG